MDGDHRRSDLRNIGIIAHVDHGKTTLVDAMLRQAHVFRANQAVQERVLDSDDLERERGITILAKNTAVSWEGVKINVVDTPGHADFGGEVERVLNMVDGVLLLVDAVEGPMPQTRFVLRKALEMGHRAVVVVNKMDRPSARPAWAVDATFDLFIDLHATDEQAHFGVVYTNALTGRAGTDPDALGDDLTPLFEEILRLPAPRVESGAAPRLLVTSLDYDEYKGRIAVGRLSAGRMRPGQSVAMATPGGVPRPGKINELFVFENLGRTAVEEATAGEIVALTGLPRVGIGETVTDPDRPEPLPAIRIEPPTVRMAFTVNDGPFAGREGQYVTSRAIRDRLTRELERNVALQVEDTASRETFLVSGRGELHLVILIENMRREGFEVAVGRPSVIFQEVGGARHEPYEDVYVDVAEEYVGKVVELLGRRRGKMLDMRAGIEAGMTSLTYRVPTRGVIGFRGRFLTVTAGTGVMHTLFAEYAPWAGDIEVRDRGSLVAHETGTTTSYALNDAQQRGTLFVGAGAEVYEGQIVGERPQAGDLQINVCRRKHVTNHRKSFAEEGIVLTPHVNMSLDAAIEHVDDDELVEVTPHSIRLRKRVLDPHKRRKVAKAEMASSVG
ncbi:MAG: translational GTPase TypA [Anaerolineae bacterium]